MTHLEIINKLIGEITPVGDSAIDAERFENLKTLCQLVDDLVYQIDNVACMKLNLEHSIVKASSYADFFLTNTLGISS